MDRLDTKEMIRERVESRLSKIASVADGGGPAFGAEAEREWCARCFSVLDVAGFEPNLDWAVLL